METSLFEYSFPKELVAQHPLPQRETSRLLVVKRQSESGVLEHHVFSDLSQYLRPGDLLVVNNAEADLVSFQGKRVPPLPPYIKRKSVEEFTEEDYKRYRTVYAKTPGSQAAPTAGFHFTEAMLQEIRSARVEIAYLTLHISHDTYKPIRTRTIEDHPMHGENYTIPAETAERVNAAKREGRRVIAVGTTTVRALESAVADSKAQSLSDMKPQSGLTQLYIAPGYRFRVVDSLITNFHRPRSTVLVMVSAFAGREAILAAYREAIQRQYRLFSYGDAMLIL